MINIVLVHQDPFEQISDVWQLSSASIVFLVVSAVIVLELGIWFLLFVLLFPESEKK